MQGMLPAKQGCCKDMPTGSADEGKLQHELGSPEPQGVNHNGWQQP